MTQQIYNEKDLPIEDFESLNLVNNGEIILDEDDLKAMLTGRSTSMLRLEDLELNGLEIKYLDAKLSLTTKPDGVLTVEVHPIYRKPEFPPYLTESEAEKLEKGEAVNLEKMYFDDEGNARDVLVEFDKETNEFIITDTERVIAPTYVNNEKLTAEQREKFRKGKEVQLPDGTTFQYSGAESQGIRSNRLALIASIIVDGGMSYILYKGLHALFGQKHDKQEASKMSEGYFQAYKEMQRQERGKRPAANHSPVNEFQQGNAETISR